MLPPRMDGARGETRNHRVDGAGLVGLFGRPFVCLDELLGLTADGLRELDRLHEEICVGLTQMPTSYTGGSHRSMGIMPGDSEAEALVDYQEVIRALDDHQFDVFRNLADDPRAIDSSERQHLEFGEERAVPLSTRQMLWLKMRHRVYFPWKVYAELILNRTWEDKSNAIGKRFTRSAEALFPKTIAFVKRLPFEGIGRCNIMGLEAHDHGTVHRDGDPSEQSLPDEFITFCPAIGKRVYLQDGRSGERTEIEGRAYWFNDNDYHGVSSDPFFRYSVRVDGVFTHAFRARLKDTFGSQS